MMIRRETLALGVLLLLGSAMPGLANGDSYVVGSTSDYFGGVPVPAPIPVPMQEARWYFRGDIGVAVPTSTDASASGRPLGYGSPLGDPVSYLAYGDWFDSDFTTHITGGVGVGHNFNHAWRGDFTYDFNDPGDIKGRGSTAQYAVFVGGVQTGNASERVGDKTSIENHVFMLNGYYDFAGHGWITPYVGGGVGVSVNTLERRATITTTSCDLGGPPPTCSTDRRRFANDSDEVTFAGALMAGASFRVSDITSIDLNYRYLYVAGFDTDLVMNDASRLSIDGIHSHQVRAGLRFDVF